MTWLPKLLGIPKFNDNHIQVIKKVSEERNAFIHYKWNAEVDEPTDLEIKEEQLKTYFKQIKGTVKYIKQFTSRVKFKGIKKEIEEKIK